MYLFVAGPLGNSRGSIKSALKPFQLFRDGTVLISRVYAVLVQECGYVLRLLLSVKASQRYRMELIRVVE